MWNGFRLAPEMNQEYALYSSDLLRTVQRLFIVVVGSLCFGWYILAHFYNSWMLISTALWVLSVVTLAGVVSLWLLSSHATLSVLVWLGGLIAGVTIAVQGLQQPEFVIFYIAIPLLATILFRWWAGVLAEVGIILLIAWLSSNPWMTSPSHPVTLITLICGALMILFGWGIMRALLIATQWSLWSLKQAQQEMDDARNQKMKLHEVQQDLVLANQELARLSDVLKVANHVAEDARRLKEEFVANVSHELRTPLNMIIGFSEMIIQAPQAYGSKLPTTLLADINAIQRNSQHLSKLVDDVLDLSQMDTGRMTLHKEWVNLRSIIDEAVIAVRALYESKQLYLTTECPADMPRLQCDSTRVRQVILNLLSNAGRFTERGGVHVGVSLQDDMVIISVRDTGPGIAPEDQNKVFEPFQQLDSSIHRRHGGSGLGLTISKRFVEMHHGKLWVESEPGVGATFYFSLPLETAQPEHVGVDFGDAIRWFSPYKPFFPRTWTYTAPIPASIPRYVVLESGQAAAQIISRYINPVDIKVVRKFDDALHELEHSPCEAMIVNSAGLSEGPILKEWLSVLPYRTPVITCWLPGIEHATQQLGVVRYMVKPVSREALFNAIDGVGVDIQSILLVDDQPELLQLFARMLSTADRRYRILQSMDGQRALSVLRERKPDLMVLDLVMPGMDGLHLLQQKSLDPAIRDIPVIIVSSRDPNSDPVASNTLTITRSGGLSAGDLIAFIQGINQVFLPESRSAGQVQSETSAA